MFSYIWSKEKLKESDKYEASYKIKGVAPLFWREHCLECAMPLCYETCKIYCRRMDGRCVRFENGIVPYGKSGAEIEFRRWAKMQSKFVGCTVLSFRSYLFVSNIYKIIERMTRSVCDLCGNYRLCQIAASFIERVNARIARRHNGILADGFLAIIKNCNEVQKKIVFEVIQNGNTVYKTAFILKPGWTETFIPLAEFGGIKTRRGFIQVYLDGDNTGRFIFGCFDFVKLAESNRPKPAKKVKCVAWDLDNTLWNGVVGEVGPENVSVRPSSRALIKSLDKRGIIQTVTSKNTIGIAWPKLEKEGLAEYFLYPAINWGRKSENLKEVSKLLNINIDTFALIDDSEFERREVSSALPQVRVYDVSEVPFLLEKDEFNVPVTEASRQRRRSYVEEAKRKEIKASWSGDYDSFLRTCGLRMTVFDPIGVEDVKRCLELINRSNQYNISGKRYEEAEFKDFVSKPNVNKYAFRVKDNFGDYGIVGVSTIVKSDSEWRLLDFVMSCRVAQKKIERAFIKWIVGEMPPSAKLVTTIMKTDRNKPLQDEFKGMSFVVEKEDDSLINLAFDTSKNIDDNVIKVVKA